MRDDLDERLAGLGRVAPEAASRVASGARRRVVDGVRAQPAERGRGARSRPRAARLGRALRISLVAGGSALIVAVVWGASIGSERATPAGAAGRPLSSYGRFDQAILRPGGYMGSAVLTQVGRADVLGHRLYLSHTAAGATCVVLMDATAQLGGARCLPRTLGSPRRPGEVFVRVPDGASPQAGRVEIEGLAGAVVRRVRLVYADGRTRDWTPRNGVFGGVVAAPLSVLLLGAQGVVLGRDTVPRSLDAG